MGTADLISETFFSTNFTSVWRSLAPSMEDFVRRWNMDGFERYWVPLASMSNPDRRGIINEAAFHLFSKSIWTEREGLAAQLLGGVDAAFLAASRYVLGNAATFKDASPTSVERREAVALAGRLYTYFKAREKSGVLEVRPSFRGSGIISSCEGDVMVGGTEIFEVKCGERNFRSVDYRQISVYAALDFAATGKPLNSMNLVNPRTGIIISVSSEVFAREVSGQSAVQLFQSLADSFTANLISI